MKLSIIIPAYNEEHRLPATLSAYCSFFQPKYADDFEMIVVVNHSTDQTERVAQEWCQQCPQIKVVVEPKQIGKGGAVELGMKQAQGDWVGFVDADGATTPQEFQKLLDQIGSASSAIASRWMPGATMNPPQSLFRRSASRLLNHLVVRHLFGLLIYDSQCGAKVFKKEVLQEILEEPIESGWAFDIDLLYRLNQTSHTVVEVPIEWHHVSGSSFSYLTMSFQMMGSVLRLKKAQYSRLKKEIK